MEKMSDVNEFTPEAGLKVIIQMIESAKSQIGRNYFYFLFWGYLVAFTCIIEYLLINPVGYANHYLVWPVFMFAGTIITLIFYLKERRLSNNRTFIGTTMGYLWTGWFIGFVALLLFIVLRQEFGMIIPVILAMYGIPVFVSGGLLSFKPLYIGAIVAWTGSFVAYFVEYPFQLIILAVVVLFSHIIPGHILKNKNNI